MAKLYSIYINGEVLFRRMTMRDVVPCVSLQKIDIENYEKDMSDTTTSNSKHL